MAKYIILGITYAFAAAAQPGPFQAYIISESVRKGWRRTLPAAFSPLISDGPIIILILVILNQVPGTFVRSLRLAGGVFLLYLAVGAFRAWRRYDSEKTMSGEAPRRTMLKAVMVNVVNPNPYLAWSLVMGPLFLAGYRESPQNGIVMLVAFYSTFILVNTGIILLFSLARKAGPRITRATLGLSVIALACFGIYQLWLGIRSFQQL